MSSSQPTQNFVTLTLTSRFSEHTLILTLACFFFSFAISISYTNSEHFRLQGHIHFFSFSLYYVAAMQSGHIAFSSFLFSNFSLVDIFLIFALSHANDVTCIYRGDISRYYTFYFFFSLCFKIIRIIQITWIKICIPFSSLNGIYVHMYVHVLHLLPFI